MSETKTTTIFEVEREARWRVWALFGLLVFVVYVVSVVVMAPVRARSVHAKHPDRPAFPGLPPVCATRRSSSSSRPWSLSLYWTVSRLGARDHMVRVMHAQPLDPDDRFHQRLADIVEEMRSATGGPAVRCLTVPTGHERLHLQRPARRRLHRRHRGRALAACRAASSRASSPTSSATSCRATTSRSPAPACCSASTPPRQRLEDATTAASHARRGSCRCSAPAPCWGRWAAAGLGGHQRRPVAPARVGRRCRRRALHARPAEPRPGLADDGQAPGRGRLPPRRPVGALCIRPTDPTSIGWFARAMATHPPVDDRITRLLNVAHVSWDEFQKQRTPNRPSSSAST